MDKRRTVEDILERLIKNNQAMCLEVLKKEPIVWENSGDCCGRYLDDDDSKEAVRTIWNFILANNQVVPTWSNYNEYHKQYGSTNELLKFFNVNMDDLIVDNDKAEIVNDIIKDILYERISQPKHLPK